MEGAGVSPPPGCVPDVASGEVKEDFVFRTAVTVSVIPAVATESVVPAGATGSCSRDIKCPSLGWDSSSSDGDTYHAYRSSNQRLLAPWVSSSSPPAAPPDSRVPTTPPVSLLPAFQSPSAFDADSSLAGFRAVDCTLRLRVEDASSCYREDDSDWVGAWRVQLSCPVSSRDTCLAHQYPNQEPAPIHSQPPSHRLSSPALRLDQRNKRPSDKLQMLSWNPGPAR